MTILKSLEAPDLSHRPGYSRQNLLIMNTIAMKDEFITIGDGVRREGTKSEGFVTFAHGYHATVLWFVATDGTRLAQPFRTRNEGQKLEKTGVSMFDKPIK